MSINFLSSQKKQITSPNTSELQFMQHNLSLTSPKKGISLVQGKYLFFEKFIRNLKISNKFQKIINSIINK